jgi:hypothetical protein
VSQTTRAGREKRGLTRPSVVSAAAYRARPSVVEPQRKRVRPSESKNERPHLFQTHTPIGRRELQVPRRPAPIADTRRAPASTTTQQVIVRSPEIVYRRELRPRTEIAGQPLHPSPAPSPARSVVRQETASEVSAKRPAALRVTDLDPALLDRLTDDVIRRVEKRVRIERERRGL